MQSSSATCNRCEIFYQGDFIDSLSHTLLAIHVAVARLAGRWQGGAFVDFFLQKQCEKGAQEPYCLPYRAFLPTLSCLLILPANPVLLDPASKRAPNDAGRASMALHRMAFVVEFPCANFCGRQRRICRLTFVSSRSTALD